MSDLDSNLAELASNGTNLELFKISFSVNFCLLSQKEQNTDLKSPRFVPLNAKLAQFEAKYEIPDLDHY